MFFGVPAEIGYLGVFLLVAGETAGALVPGETALIVAGALASRGELSLPIVIAAGAAGAIVGDNVGFVVGGRGLRFLLTTGGRWPRERAWLVAEGERFFTRHGPKAVLFARWLPGLRLVGAWFAGGSGMRWRVFAFWNVVGGIAWSTSVGTGAYLLGRAAGWAFGLVGLALGTVLVVALGATFTRRRMRRHLSDADRPPARDS